MQTQKWVNLGLLLATASIYLFLSKLTGTLWDMAHLPVPRSFPVEPYYVLSFVISAAGGFCARKNSRANSFLNEVVLELSRVSWPNQKETVASAGVVIVLVAIASLLLFLIDTIWGTMIRGLMAL